MADPHKPLPTDEKTPTGAPRPVPDTEAPEKDFVEGPLPGLPLQRDPLREPGPTPPMREKPPLD